MTPAGATDAFVLRLTPLGEADRVVQLLTRDRGRVSALARGARRSRKRFGAALDYFHRLEVRLRRGRGDLWRLDSVDLARRCTAPVGDLEAFAAASHVLEVARLGSRDGDPDPDLFDLVDAALAALDRGGDPASLTRVFQVRALAVLGYGWDVRRCSHCGRAMGADARVGAGCAVVCARCAGPGAPVLPPGAVRTLAAAAALPLDRLGSLRVDRSVDDVLGPLLARSLASAVGTRPRTGPDR